ncbi:MAG: hypothetical protein GY859_23925 [Desulfobacterales bacterium]|nr:hypothetical protein [Desulfobacterales bacterium]
MDLMSSDISAVIFKRVNRDDLGSFSFDSQMLSVLMELDGKKNMGVIAKRTGMNMGDLRDAISRLWKLKLIEPLQKSRPVLDQDFLDFIRNELSFAIGPIADIVLEDGIDELGLDISRVPSQRAAELVDLLAREIRRPDKVAAFKQNMLNKIREKKY